MDAVIIEMIVRGTVTRDFDARLGAERYSDEFVHDGNLRVALIAADNGIGQAEPRESPALTCKVLRLNSRE